MNLRFISILLFITPQVFAWEFSQALTITELQAGEGSHHLQTATARAMAITGNTVGLVWEDNHTGKPAVYFALKTAGQNQFSPARKLSAESPGYEPTITAHGDQFVVMWESEQHIYGSLCRVENCMPAAKLSPTPARQVSMTTDHQGKVYLVWAARLANVYQLQTAQVDILKDDLRINSLQTVTPAPTQNQSYPDIAVMPQGVTVVYEDREQGHSRLMTVFKPHGKKFLAPALLNDFTKTPNARYGAGTGAMRAQLAHGQQRLAVVWLDKRYFEGGYDVYAAMSNDGGRSFTADEKVQDMLGEGYPQWHANIAMSRTGHVVVAWDDPRDGDMDIWFSWRTAEDWSDDEPIPGARGDGEQSNPALAFDNQGKLHIAYVDTRLVNDKKASRLRYIIATPATK